METNQEQIVAMAAAVIAEEEGTPIEAIKVVSFREVHKSSLEQYISDHNIQYRKYQLGD
jgi:hypothetical protein